MSGEGIVCKMHIVTSPLFFWQSGMVAPGLTVDYSSVDMNILGRNKKAPLAGGARCKRHGMRYLLFVSIHKTATPHNMPAQICANSATLGGNNGAILAD